MVDTLPVNFNNDVLGFYHKQKSEFHFQQKTDNEFLMFLLDTAVRVISIVQHLAPVIEAVSEASNEAEEALDEEEYNLQQQINQQQLEQFNHQQNDVAVMEVDSLAEEVIKDQIAVAPPPPPIPDPAAAQQAAHQVNITHIAEKLIAEQLLESFNSQSNQSIPISVPIQSTAPSVILPSDNIPISIPITQPSELIQQDEDIKSENNIPEIIEIKEEPSPQPLLPDDQLQQLMSSISSNEDNFRIQNFVPTAQPSNLPQSFLDRNTNPLSMLSLSSSSSGSGGKPPPLLSAPFDSNLFSNISTDKLPGTSGALDTKGLDSKGNSSSTPVFNASIVYEA